MELADVIRQLYGEDVYITDKAEISGGDIKFETRISDE